MIQERKIVCPIILLMRWLNNQTSYLSHNKSLDGVNLKVMEESSKFEKLKINSLDQIVKGKRFGQLISDIVVNMLNFLLDRKLEF